MNYEDQKAIFLTAASAFLLSGCAGNNPKLTAYDAQYLDYFDTITSITICAESEEQFQEYKSLAEDTIVNCKQYISKRKLSRKTKFRGRDFVLQSLRRRKRIWRRP